MAGGILFVAGDRKMSDGPTKVFVLVDRLYGDKRARTSLWKGFLTGLNYSQVDPISLWEEKTKNKTVRPDDANVLIINWDNANGDYVCGSDVVLTYFQAHGHRRDALMQRNGKLICEFQSGMGVLKQVSYDAIFGPGEVEVVDIIYPPNLPRREHDKLSEEEIEQLKQAERPWIGKSVSCLKKYYKKDHPILAPLEDKLPSLYNSADPLYHFEEGAQQEKFCWYRHAPDGAIYHGWFCNWKKGWVPLLVAEPAERWPWWERLFTPPPAVLLAKSYKGGGIMLATTMWLAVPGTKELVKQILDTDVRAIEKTHKYYKRARFVTDLLWGIILGVIIWLLMVHFPRFKNGLIGDLGKFWLSLIGYRFWRHFFFNRPYGVNPFGFANRARKAFWDTL